MMTLTSMLNLDQVRMTLADFKDDDEKKSLYTESLKLMDELDAALLAPIPLDELTHVWSA